MSRKEVKQYDYHRPEYLVWECFLAFKENINTSGLSETALKACIRNLHFYGWSCYATVLLENLYLLRKISDDIYKKICGLDIIKKLENKGSFQLDGHLDVGSLLKLFEAILTHASAKTAIKTFDVPIASYLNRLDLLHNRRSLWVHPNYSKLVFTKQQALIDEQNFCEVYITETALLVKFWREYWLSLKLHWSNRDELIESWGAVPAFDYSGYNHLVYRMKGLEYAMEGATDEYGLLTAYFGDVGGGTFKWEDV